MYIKLKELVSLLGNPAWKYYKDTNGNTVFDLINKCEVVKEVKKVNTKKGGK